MNTLEKNSSFEKKSEDLLKSDRILPKCNSVRNNNNYSKIDLENETQIIYKDTEDAPTFYKAFVGRFNRARFL